MQQGVIDLISVIPKEGLNPKGINYIAVMILYYCAEDLQDSKDSKKYKKSLSCWSEFWDQSFIVWVFYFWMIDYRKDTLN